MENIGIKNPWIVIPTYNERPNIRRMLPALTSLKIPNLSILIVDDNSPDGTDREVQQHAANNTAIQLLSRPRKSGLGRAYIAGMAYALEHGADAIVQLDADFSHNPYDIPMLLHGLNRADLVLGSRYSQGISVINWPLKRLMISMAANVYVRTITGLPLHDATGGFRAWRAETLRRIDLPSIAADGYGFQIITAYRTWKQGLHIDEVPIVFTERRAGQSKMSKHIIWEAMLLVWKLRLFGWRHTKTS
ncbi:MAG: dolichyl-phosphate beta-D-mannosyltransferase [Candidatus Andersenbacteria bacterium CG10_big_fil_rev_8_21_14_0_10_54_11]|uniref:Dolichyl-phosphate beta-D-mannosyltransferase n=1 Tax=Candidatus Andersenbacteria bacterium CG10_big_fil_rev_8_21_14_0_10_54_11 TaxID=1974485 RepID=A0A2M6X0G0_9BACT|nr:MAG: dolichyl-phosphate beta-D-mannosyltransferase [Candidatus Andersenbacteria bacterium CG10_big_fil_rev_8_21_14_0_10_54_11]